MKVTVDSGEFTRAVSIVSRYTESSSVGVTSAILLQAAEHELTLRTTTFDKNCIVRVNAFEVEDGEAVILAKNMQAAARDTGGMVEIRTTTKKLFLETERSKIGLMQLEAEAGDFPVWQEPDYRFNIPAETLTVASSAFIAEDKGGRPALACIHIVPRDDKVALFTVTGFRGAMAYWESEIEETLTIDAKALSSALPLLGGIVTIGIGRTAVELSSDGSPTIVSFSRSNVQPLDNLVDSWFLEKSTEGKFTIDRASILTLMEDCKLAYAIDSGSEMLIEGKEDEIKTTYIGHGVDIDTTIPGKGRIEDCTFLCRTLYETLHSMRECEEYEISLGLTGENAIGWMRITGNGDIYKLMASSGARFKKQVEDNGI